MNHIAEIQKVKETDKGTILQIFVPDSFLEIKIDRYKKGNKAYAELKLDDGRRIRSQQRKMYYSTLRDIANHTGHLEEQLHSYFKMIYKFMYEDINISMSNCTVSQARQMIDILIEFVITRDIPLSDLGINRTDNTDKYLYLCIVNRKCVCCGAKADVHHCTGSRIGMGGNRNKVNHKGRSVIALCREHHNQIHSTGEEEFCDKHKVYGLKLDEYAVKKLKL